MGEGTSYYPLLKKLNSMAKKLRNLIERTLAEELALCRNLLKLI